MTSRSTHDSPNAARTLLAGALMTLWAFGCTDAPPATPDAARKDTAADVGDVPDGDARGDAALDRADARADRTDASPDAPMDAPPPDLEYVDLGPFVPDEDVPASYDVNLDRSWDVARPDVTFQFMNVAALFPDVPPPDRPFPPCTPGTIESCACPDGRSGFQTCEYDYDYSTCACADPPPVITTPRLVAPLSGMRVSSQRPTLRWQLPTGLTRARVELCADRPCTRMLGQAEVTGSSWRSPTRLAPGLTFWRVRGLDAAGTVAWTSATWLFQVRRRDTEVDTTLGRILDFNGDGYDDLPMLREMVGDLLGGLVVDVFFGTPDGLTPEPLLTIQLPEAELNGPFRIRSFSVGDVDGDGCSDLVTNVEGAAPSTRLSKVLYGYRGGRLQPLGRRSWRMRLPVEFSGEPVDFPDLNGDGFAEMVTRGEAIFRGSESGPASAPEYVTWYGPLRPARWQAAGVDLNRDGFPDAFYFADSSWTDLVCYGPGRLSFDQWIQDMGLPRLPFRQSYPHATTGDFNGDGYADIIQVDDHRSFPEATRRHLMVIRGGPLQLSRDTVRSTPLLPGHGGSVFWTGRAGDVNGDGFSDLAVPIEDWDDDTVRVTLYAGGDAGLSTVPTMILGDFRNAAENFSVTLPGDFNGDGFDDVVVSEPRSSGFDVSAYNVMVFHGASRPPNTPDRLYVRNRPVSVEQLGF